MWVYTTRSNNKNPLTEFGVRFDQVANVYFSDIEVNAAPMTLTPYYDDLGNIISGQIGEIINHVISLLYQQPKAILNVRIIQQVQL